MRLPRLLLAGFVIAATLAPAASFADAQQGRKAWMKYNCYGCHGNNAAGGMGPNIQHQGGGDVSEAMNGDAKEGGMRSYAGIATATDATNISTYLGTIGTPNEPKWLDWWNH
jgi:mono/diheme cytochrome c family protein